MSIRREDRREAERQADRRFPDLILAPENEQRAVDFADGFEAGVLWRDEQADREPSERHDSTENGSVVPPSDAELDAAYEAFRAHDRGEEFNELGEHVCSECGYAYSWPAGDPVVQVSPHRRRQRHKARAALLAAQEVRGRG